MSPRADLAENWNAPTYTNGWYNALAQEDQYHLLEWLPDHGVDNTGFVYSRLENLSIIAELPGAFWPLWTWAWTSEGPEPAHPANFLHTPEITVSIAATPLSHQGPPHTVAADLKGGRIEFFVAEFHTREDQVHYWFKGGQFEIGTNGWVRSTVTLNPDPALWDADADGATGSRPLEEILREPQQWGFAIRGATEHPTGWLGFDDVRIARRLVREQWDRQRLDFTEGWNVPSHTNGWYNALAQEDQYHLLEWLPDHGMDNTGFVYSRLEDLSVIAGLPGAFWPLWTWAWTSVGPEPAYPMNFLLTPVITISLAATPLSHQGPPHTVAADLKGGRIEFFVAEFHTREDQVHYWFKGGQFEVGTNGWVRSTVTLDPDPALWDADADGPTGSRPLEEILRDPQQWGFAIRGATEHPTGRLGFDDLRIARPQGAPSPDVNGWSYYDAAAEGPQIHWARDGGVGGSGYIWCPLDELAEWAATPGARYPLTAYGNVRNQVLHPVDLVDRNVVTFSLNPACVIDGLSASPADLKGGDLNFWVGRWNGLQNYTFYRYTREAIAAQGANWTTNRITLTPSPEDWRLMGGTARPVAEILADPQQWGVALFGASGQPTGVLGFDSLAIRCQAHNWNQDHDTNAWFYYPGSDPGRHPLWQPLGGWGNSGYVICPLDELRTWGPTGNRYYPLYCVAAQQKANLLEKPRIKTVLNFMPGGSARLADLHGALTLYVGQWDRVDSYVHYFFRTAFATANSPGWSASELRLTADTNDWDIVVAGTPSLSLAQILQNPQQWGLAIVNATGQPTGSLGFDDLELSPLPVQALAAHLSAPATVELSVRGSPNDCVFLLSTEELSDHTSWVEHAPVYLDDRGTGTWRERTHEGPAMRFFDIMDILD